jgi:tetratricopeptide (TPR) repeat protein
MLRDWARAIEDLDKAILLNPRYANAYQIRAIAKRSIGDAPGAAADSERSQQLIHSK